MTIQTPLGWTNELEAGQKVSSIYFKGSGETLLPDHVLRIFNQPSIVNFNDVDLEKIVLNYSGKKPDKNMKFNSNFLLLCPVGKNNILIPKLFPVCYAYFLQENFQYAMFSKVVSNKDLYPIKGKGTNKKYIFEKELEIYFRNNSSETFNYKDFKQLFKLDGAPENYKFFFD